MSAQGRINYLWSEADGQGRQGRVDVFIVMLRAGIRVARHGGKQPGCSCLIKGLTAQHLQAAHTMGGLKAEF